MDLQLHGMAFVEPEFAACVEGTRSIRVSYRHTAAPRAALDFLERFKYVLDHTTKSGHNDTSSRNSFLNAVVTTAALRSIGVTAARVLVIGDDMLCFLKGPVDCDSLLQAEHDCGIKPVGAVFPPDQLSKVTFASDAFAPTADGTYIAIPMIGKLLAKLFATTSQVRQADQKAFAHSISVGLSNLLARAPIYGTFIRTMIDTSAGDKPLMPTHKWERRVTAAVEYDDSFYGWLFDRYGLTRTQLDEFDLFLKDCREPGYLVHPVASVFMQMDLSDPADRLDL